MNRKITWAISFLLLLSALGVAYKAPKIRASATIFIRADGSIYPLSAAISSVDNATYTLMADINASIVVERSNIIIQGADHTIQGDGGGNGFSLFSVHNVTIRKVNIHNFYFGVYFARTSHSVVIENNITFNSYDGIQFLESAANTISNNSIAENSDDGVKMLNASNNNIISENIVTRNYDDGIQLYNCSGNTVSRNNITTNARGLGINVGRSLNANISDNNVINNMRGIGLFSSTSNCTVLGNKVLSNGYGLYLDSSSKNFISGNNVTNSQHGAFLYSSSNNMVYGNIISTSGADGIWLNYSPDNSVGGNDITSSGDSGVYLRYSANNTISRNSIRNNYDGISMTGSSSNKVYGNNITDNQNGASLLSYSFSNMLFQNNFANNTQQASSSSSNVWNENYEGNYWSGFAGVDSNNDGIGDSPYVMDVDNKDNFPLMGMFHTFDAPKNTMVDVISNSSTSDFQVVESLTNVTIRMHVSNMTLDQTSGFCRVRIPRALMKGPFSVTVDGSAPLLANYTIRDNGTYRWIYFSYQHSTREIIIQGLESTPPHVNIISPESKTYPINVISLIFTVDETTSWIGYSLDGQANATVTGNETLPSFSDGTHSVIVFANDTVGNMGLSNTIRFTVDTTPPTILIITPENRTYGSNQVLLVFTINEPISWMGYSLDGNVNATIVGNTTLGGLTNRGYTIKVYANDTVGNMGSSSTVYFTVFNLAPSVYILSPQNRTYATTDVQLTFWIDKPVNYMSYSLDGQANVTIAGNTTLTSIPEGRHRIVVYANGTDGNMGSSDTTRFTIDITPPDIGSVSQSPPAGNVLPTDIVKVNATVTDTLSGLKTVVLNCTTDNRTWFAINMTKIEGNIWNGTIPAFPLGTNVTYVIRAEDNVNHTITTGDLGYTYRYTVVPEFPTFLTLLLFGIATLVAAAAYKRKRHSSEAL